MKLFIFVFLLLLINSLFFVSGCNQQSQENTNILEISRYDKIPSNATKITSEIDVNPPKSHSSDYQDPVPVSGKLNSAGAEDSPFIMPDGNTFYFFFTPDVNIPAEKQLFDGVTGIWVSTKQNNGEFGEPERIILQDKNKIALDGCEFVQNNQMFFCTAREGYTGINWFSAEFKDNKWQNWKNANFNPDYNIGELYVTKDGNEIYYHANRPGGKGGLDIWKIKKNEKGEWQTPENVEAINTEKDEGWPALNPSENELWVTKDYGLWRSKKDINGNWQKPELIISPLAGEATLDNQGNVYFTHHFYKDNKMLEADIYVAYKK